MVATGVLLPLSLATPAYAEPTSATGAVGTAGGDINAAEAADRAWILEHLGIQVAALSQSLVESVQQAAPNAAFTIVPSALSPQVTVSVDPQTVPDITAGATAGSSESTTDQRSTKVSVDMSAAILATPEGQRLQALASVLAVPSESALQVVVTPLTGGAPVFN